MSASVLASVGAQRVETDAVTLRKLLYCTKGILDFKIDFQVFETKVD